MIDISKLTIAQVQQDLRDKTYSAVDLYEACKKNIEEKNEELNAFLEVFDDALDQAKRADEMLAAGDAKPLTGIVFSIKDNILYKGHVASASSKMLENYVATYNATAVQDLLDQGAVIIGRTNMDEFAMGSSTETSAFGITRNPHDTTRVPGGSSGGAAVSVAMGGCLCALGSDTAGSVRLPASFCGVVGFKPSYGGISRHGLMAMGSSLDVIGPLTKTVEDAKIVYDVLGHGDDMDATSVPDSHRHTDTKEVKKIGVPRDFVDRDGVDPETKQAFEHALEKLAQQGYEIVDIEMPLAQYALPAYYVIIPAEVSSNLGRYDGIRYGLSVSGDGVDGSYMKTREQGFGKEVKRRILLGTYVLSHGYLDAYYNKAVAVRNQIKKDFERVFEEVDIIATPTSPTPAFELDSKKDPVSMYLMDIFTVPANIAGVPAVSVPNGTTKDGLPLDIHFTAPEYCEQRLFKLGSAFEQ